MGFLARIVRMFQKREEKQPVPAVVPLGVYEECIDSCFSHRDLAVLLMLELYVAYYENRSRTTDEVDEDLITAHPSIALHLDVLAEAKIRYYRENPNVMR